MENTLPCMGCDDRLAGHADLDARLAAIDKRHPQPIVTLVTGPYFRTTCAIGNHEAGHLSNERLYADRSGRTFIQPHVVGIDFYCETHTRCYECHKQMGHKPGCTEGAREPVFQIRECWAAHKVF